MVEMEIVGVRVELPTNAPIVLLRESDGTRMLPIFIGAPEATAIALALDDVETPRPMTHDLLADTLRELGGELQQVTVTELIDKTFYAELSIGAPSGTVTLSSRPSDAIALALRVGAPIFAADDVVESAGYVITDDDDDDEGVAEEVVEQFKEFIDSVRPEDFES